MFSKKRDCMPVAPTLPISSLSTKRQHAVFCKSFASNIANNDVNAHTLSSCPYAKIILLSMPQSRAFPAGTTSNSAETKSSSSISYFSFSIWRRFALTASFSSPPNGLLPINTSNFSPSMTFAAFVSNCSAAK